MLLHQLPKEPKAIRMRVWRALKGMGCLQVKNAMYLLPWSDANHKKLKETAKMIRDLDGTCFIIPCDAIDGIDAKPLRIQFQEISNRSYDEIDRALRRLLSSLRGSERVEAKLMNTKHELGRLYKKFEEAKGADHFPSRKQKATTSLFQEIELSLNSLREDSQSSEVIQQSIADFQSKIWVTRQNIHVDRIASAWLIREFIDPQAKFKFTKSKHYRPNSNEVRFDMFDGEFTHIQELCTFEVLVEAFKLKSNGIRQLAEIIHDLDLNDQRYNHPETLTVKNLLNGIIKKHKADDERIKQASSLLGHLLISLQ